MSGGGNDMLAAMMRQMQQGQAAGGGQQGESPLVSFRAGIMHHDKVNGGPKLKLAPDRRRGEILLQKNREGIPQFIWKNRASGSKEVVSAVNFGRNFQEIR
eukprot:gb/GECG01009939.1/.p1 GENE.gb/GECG01009939.1/~~gb/GECG01009939.1/.p1  ORF type:complete len:101 (+),score=13.19 gb/GECG01009939.1/:1-303(+)